MGQRFRLKKTFTIPTTWSVQSKAIATAFQDYGIILADIGSDMYIQGEPSASWDSMIFTEVQSITTDQFEAVDISPWKNGGGFDPMSGIVPAVPGNPSPTRNGVARESLDVLVTCVVGAVWGLHVL